VKMSITKWKSSKLAIEIHLELGVGATMRRAAAIIIDIGRLRIRIGDYRL